MVELVGSAGSFNIKKYLKSLGSKTDGGNTKSHLIKELIDNCFDANCENININLIDNKDNPSYGYIIIKDDGSGMILDDLKRLLEFYSINMSTNEKSNGKYGIGAKRAIVGLSNFTDDDFNKETCIITKNKNNEVLSCAIKWNTINSIADFIDKIPIMKGDSISVDIMSEFKTGTRIKIETNIDIINELRAKLNVIEDDDIIDNRRDNDLELDLALSYSRYLTNSKKINIDNMTIRPYLFYEKDNNDYILKEIFNLDIYVSDDKEKRTYYHLKYNNKQYYIGKHGNGRMKKFKELSTNVPSFYNEKGRVQLQFAIDMSASGLNDTGTFIYKAPSEKPEFKKFRGLIENINVIRGDKNLNTLPLKPKITGDQWKRPLFKNMYSELKYSSKMDDIINITQDNKSVTNWDNTPIGFKTAVECIHEMFVQQVIIPYCNKKETELKKLETNDDLSNSQSDDLSDIQSDDLSDSQSDDLGDIVNNNITVDSDKPVNLDLSNTDNNDVHINTIENSYISEDDSDSIEGYSSDILSNMTRHRAGHDVTVSKTLLDCLILFKQITDNYHIKEYIKSYKKEDNNELQTGLFKELKNLKDILDNKKLSDINEKSQI